MCQTPPNACSIMGDLCSCLARSISIFAPVQMVLLMNLLHIGILTIAAPPTNHRVILSLLVIITNDAYMIP